MPIIKSAFKKMRQDRAKTKVNQAKKEISKKAIKTFLKEKNSENFKKVVSLIDKLAKTNIIHKNKAARLKSRLAKQLKK